MDTVTNLVTHLASELSWFLISFKAEPLCFEVSLGGNAVFGLSFVMLFGCGVIAA